MKNLRHSRCVIRRFIGLTFALLIFSGAAAVAQTNVAIEQLSFESAHIRVMLKHPVAGSTNFTLQGSSNLTSIANWSNLPGGTLTVLDGGHIEFRVPRPADPLQFFRVLATISTNDVDADGLPAIAEAGLGTDPNKVDTDGDGYSDGLEVIAGTNPLDPNSFPSSSRAAVAAFTNTVSVANETSGSLALNVVFDRPPTTNVLHYTINPRSTAVAGRDYQALSGTALVSGNVATIFIIPKDDLVVRGERSLLVDLMEVSGYRIGIRGSHSVRFVDDDAYWNGTLKDRYAERNFRLMLSRSNSVMQACFVAGEGQDGLPILNTNAPGSSISEGVIPAGCHTATVTTNTATLFSITSPELAAGSAGIFAGNASLARTFSLDSAAANTNHHIDEILIVGTYTERIGITNTVSSYLDQTNSGAFILVRELPGQTTVTNGLTLPPSP